MNLIKRIGLPSAIIVLTLVFTSGVALAQTQTTVDTATGSSDISPKLAQLAQELHCQTNADCAKKFDANIETGITLAQKYDIYTPEQKQIATTFKTEVLEKLRTVSQDNFEETIVALAGKILKEKPVLAKSMGVTEQNVTGAQTIITTVKDAGVNLRTCQKSPENLSREQLIACVKASNDLSSKGNSVGDYIPKENIKAGDAQKMVDLDNALLAGDYPGLGRVNTEQAGQICLKSNSDSNTDCDKIAEKFFGAEGVKSLQDARQQVTKANDYYANGFDKMQLITPDGQKLIGKDSIKNACNQAFDSNNVELMRACGNFAVKNGYTTDKEVQDGLKLLQSFSQKAQGVNFNDCRLNPDSCKNLLPDEFRSQYDSQSKIFQAMSDSIGFDPSRCANSQDPNINKQCLEGAKNALGRVEEIAKNSPDAQKIVDQIKAHIADGEQMTRKLDEFNQNSKSGITSMAGPGGCTEPAQCFNYCNQPANSAECISFGAKSQIFDPNTVAQKFNMVNDALNNNNVPNSSKQFGQQPNQLYQNMPQQPAGPSPECFSAISSGDFARAKTACSNVTNTYDNTYKQMPVPYPICPRITVSMCPDGQIRQPVTDVNNCPTYGACVPIDSYKPVDINSKSCSSNQYWDGKSCVSSVTSKECTQGMFWDISTQSCKFSPVPPVQTVNSCDFSTQYWKSSTSQCMPRTNCTTTSNSDYNSMECQGLRSMTQPIVGSCGSLTSQTSCQAVSGCGWANGACGGNMPTNNTCSMGQYWNGTSCVNSPTTGQCPSGQNWYTPPSGMGYCMANQNCPTGYHAHSENGGFCINSQENYSGTCYNSAGTSIIACPQNTSIMNSCDLSTQYWKSSTNQCMPRTNCTTTSNPDYNSMECQGVRNMTQPMTGSSCGLSSSQTQSACMALSGCNWSNNACSSAMMNNGCSSGQYWNGTACVTSSTTTGQCPQGQYWYAPSGGGTGYCMTSSNTNCTSGQYWNGSACVSNSNMMDPAVGCTQAGGTWNSTTNFCTMPNSNGTSCSSGQYWNGSACVSNSNTTSGSSSCTSTQYWNGSACVSNSNNNMMSPSAGCAQAGGTWNGSSCQMPNSGGDSSGGGSSNMGAMCAQAGGTWNGSSCQMPTSMVLCSKSGGQWTGAACNLAENISNQKAYYAYFHKMSDASLAQVLRAFTNLFKK